MEADITKLIMETDITKLAGKVLQNRLFSNETAKTPLTRFNLSTEFLRLFYREYEKMKAMNRLMSELDKARMDADKNGWLSADEVFKEIAEEYNV